MFLSTSSRTRRGEYPLIRASIPFPQNTRYGAVIVSMDICIVKIYSFFEIQVPIHQEIWYTRTNGETRIETQRKRTEYPQVTLAWEMIHIRHKEYMALALKEAETALLLGEVPVGCVIVKAGKIVSVGHNTRETNHSALGHAEISAISQACMGLNSWRLSGCTLYVTLEPCPMCMGAILNARFDRVVFGAPDLKMGCCGSYLNLNDGSMGHSLETIGGIMESECAKILKTFFQTARQKDAVALRSEI